MGEHQLQLLEHEAAPGLARGIDLPGKLTGAQPDEKCKERPGGERRQQVHHQPPALFRDGDGGGEKEHLEAHDIEPGGVKRDGGQHTRQQERPKPLLNSLSAAQLAQQQRREHRQHNRQTRGLALPDAAEQERADAVAVCAAENIEHGEHKCKQIRAALIPEQRQPQREGGGRRQQQKRRQHRRVAQLRCAEPEDPAEHGEHALPDLEVVHRHRPDDMRAHAAVERVEHGAVCEEGNVADIERVVRVGTEGDKRHHQLERNRRQRQQQRDTPRGGRILPHAGERRAAQP